MCNVDVSRARHETRDSSHARCAIYVACGVQMTCGAIIVHCGRTEPCTSTAVSAQSPAQWVSSWLDTALVSHSGFNAGGFYLSSVANRKTGVLGAL